MAAADGAGTAATPASTKPAPATPNPAMPAAGAAPSPETAGDPLAGLADIRGAEPTPARLGADAAAAFSVGLVLALLAAGLWRLVTRRPADARSTALAALAAAAALDPGDRAAAMARIATAAAARRAAGARRPDAGPSDAGSSAGVAPPGFATEAGRRGLARYLGVPWFESDEAARFAAALYRPDPDLDLGSVERRIAAALRRLPR